MHAELHGKVSSTGSNLSDRLEDQLTGDFFGLLRYISINHGFHSVVSSTSFFEQQEKGQFNHLISNLPNDGLWKYLTFWPWDAEGEMDVLIDFPNVTIGIEVKYLSGLSSDDEVDAASAAESVSQEDSVNQLARESRIINRLRQDKPGVLIFLAKEPEVFQIASRVKKRGILVPNVLFGYLSWEECLLSLQDFQRSAEELSGIEGIIISDLISLLKKKGFERFEKFDLLPRVEVIGELCFEFSTEDNEPIVIFAESDEVDGGLYYEFV